MSFRYILFSIQYCLATKLSTLHTYIRVYGYEIKTNIYFRCCILLNLQSHIWQAMLVHQIQIKGARNDQMSFFHQDFYLRQWYILSIFTIQCEQFKHAFHSHYWILGMYFYLYTESTLVTMCFTTNKDIRISVNKIKSQRNSEK